MSGDRKRSLTAVALVAVAVVWAAWRAYGLWWCTDDAYISFRYARNLVDGLGLVYNAGERVEGFTNPLWTLWVACGLALGVAQIAHLVAWIDVPVNTLRLSPVDSTHTHEQDALHLCVGLIITKMGNHLQTVANKLLRPVAAFARIA